MCFGGPSHPRVRSMQPLIIGEGDRTGMLGLGKGRGMGEHLPVWEWARGMGAGLSPLFSRAAETALGTVCWWQALSWLSHRSSSGYPICCVCSCVPPIQSSPCGKTEQQIVQLFVPYAPEEQFRELMAANPANKVDTTVLDSKL